MNNLNDAIAIKAKDLVDQWMDPANNIAFLGYSGFTVDGLNLSLKKSWEQKGS